MSALSAATGFFKPECPYYLVKNATGRIDMAMFRASEANGDLKQMTDTIRRVFSQISTNPYNQVVFVHDLLTESLDRTTLGSARKAMVALELFFKLPMALGREYHLYILEDPKLMHAFITALTVNASFHEVIEEKTPGKSGLTPAELKFESYMAHCMLPFYKPTTV
jgi:hypothetical protein